MGIPVERAEQDRRGLAERRRLDRERGGRPRRQHADGLRRAHRRLGDPARRGRPRHPVPDDALGRAGRGAGDRRRAARGRRRCSRCRRSTRRRRGGGRRRARRSGGRSRPPAEAGAGGPRHARRRRRVRLAGGPRPRPVAAGPGARRTTSASCARAAGACPGSRRCCAAPGPAGPARASGPGPRPAGPVAWPPASTRTRWPSTPSGRWGSARGGRDRHRAGAARQPAPRWRACPPTARSSTAWASTTGARRRRPRAWPAGARPGARRVVVGVNLGAHEGRRRGRGRRRLRRRRAPVAPYADYVVVNVSSPNTPGLRDLQAVARRCAPLLVAVREALDEAGGGAARAAAREDRAGPGRRRRRRGRRPRARARARRHRRDEHDDRPRRDWPARGGGARPRARAGCPGRRSRRGALAVLRRLRARTATGSCSSRRAGSRRRRTPGPGSAPERRSSGLHGLRARRPALAGGHAPGARGAGPPRRLRDRRRGDRGGRLTRMARAGRRRPPAVGPARRGGRSACGRSAGHASAPRPKNPAKCGFAGRRPLARPETLPTEIPANRARTLDQAEEPSTSDRGGGEFGPRRGRARDPCVDSPPRCRRP